MYGKLSTLHNKTSRGVSRKKMGKVSNPVSKNIEVVVVAVVTDDTWKAQARWLKARAN